VRLDLGGALAEGFKNFGRYTLDFEIGAFAGSTSYPSRRACSANS
jgi:hypothetical protein